MKEVGIRELKNRLSEYVRLVRSGEHVMITDRGEIVAEMNPPGTNLQGKIHYPGLLELAKRGKVRLGKPNNPALYPSRPVRRRAGTAAKLIDQGRDE